MNNGNQIEMLTLERLFEDKKYVIPLYQRNYTWGKAEVEQLVQDVWDSVIELKSENYYLGTLVTYARDHDGVTYFEAIDGQQRLTTLSILSCVLKNEFDTNLSLSFKDSLKFDSRPLSTDSLFQLSIANPDFTKVSTKMADAYHFILNKIEDLGKNKDRKKEFLNYFLQRVKLLHVQVPYDTDLNHYFEIMNNRGEQLEKHEVLKAKLLSHLKDDKRSQKTFAMIWDACSYMEQYLQYGFEKDLRDAIFGKSWSELPDGFEAISVKIEQIAKKQNAKNYERKDLTIDAGKLLDVLDKSHQKIKTEKNEDVEDEKFNSILTFPNFLLHTLRVLTRDDIALDDKRLNESFNVVVDEQGEDKAAWVKKFGFTLFKLKFLYDGYIIKRYLRSDEEEWGLKEIKEGDKGNHYYAGTFADQDQNEQVMMLLSMFHVSFPQMIYKHWLNGALLFLHDAYKANKTVHAAQYINYLERMSDAFYFDRVGEQERDYYEIIYTYENKIQNTNIQEDQYLHQGTKVQNFIFNRLDYLLWKSVKNEEEKFAFRDKEKAKKFRFSVGNTSVEHYCPRNPVKKDGILIHPQNIDKFGNLCLIGRSKNAKLSNHNPSRKADYYSKSDRIDSLKQKLMLRQSENWTDEVLEEHQNEMIKLLATRVEE